MFLKLFQSQGVRGFAKQFHTQMCLAALFDQRRKVENEWKKVENEWNDDEDEQRRVFHEEEGRNSQKHEKKEKQQLTCEMTGKTKRPDSVDCSCKGMCLAKKSETYIIHYEGGIGIIQQQQ